jgi:hypothetical protein
MAGGRHAACLPAYGALGGQSSIAVPRVGYRAGYTALLRSVGYHCMLTVPLGAELSDSA